MSGEKNERRAMIAILLTSTLLTMLGIAGVLSGTYELRSAPIPENLQDLFPPEDEEDAEGSAARESRLQLFEAQVSNPYRRPMAAANVGVSSLVLIGSFMLSWRRKLSQWWIRQAVFAKLIWIVAYTVTFVSHLKLVFPTLPMPEAGGATLGELIRDVVLSSLLTGALHLAALWRASRPDIGAFIEASAKAPR